MKFSDGYWLTQPGYDLFYASVPYEIDVSEHAIHVLATQVLNSRGDTLQGPVLDVYFSSDLENTIRVKVEHYRGARKKGPEYQLYAQEGFAPTTMETDEYAELISGKTRVRIHKGNAWLIEYYYEDRLLTKEGWRSTSYITEAPYHTQERMLAQKNFNRFFADDQDEATAYTRGQLNLSVGESIYGFGEKFTTFVKNGQKVEMWNSDGGTCTEYSYKSIPFYVSNRSYGVFVNHSEKVSFEVGSDTVSKVSFTVPGERLEYIIKELRAIPHVEIVRIGSRGYGAAGTLVLDPMFEEHFTNVKNAGLKVGVYFFSQATTEAEAREEAFACAYVLNGRKLDYPIFFDTEASGASNGSGRADGLGMEDRTKCAIAFCEEVKAQGYKPGVYASTLWYRKRIDLNSLKKYTIWNAHYGVASSPIDCALWQGTCTARLPGYKGDMDVNISYIG